MKLSQELADAIDGAEESRGFDAQLTRWAEMAERLESAALPPPTPLISDMRTTSSEDPFWKTRTVIIVYGTEDAVRLHQSIAGASISASLSKEHALQLAADLIAAATE